MKKLDGVHPALVEKVRRIMVAMATSGHPMLITDGVRTAAQQHALYEQGRTKPGRIVTQCDGRLTPSNHQPKADGLGRAVDCCFLVNGVPSWDDINPWALYGDAAKAEGLVWGGDWRLPDRPHIEMRDDVL